LPLSVVGQAAAKTEKLDGVRVDVASKIESATSFRIKGSGAFAFDQGRGRLALTLFNPLDGASVDTGEVFDGPFWYVQSSAIAGDVPGAGGWAKIDLRRAEPKLSVDPAPLLSTDARSLLETLRATKNVKMLGRSKVDGELLTHYRATIDPQATPRPFGSFAAISKPAYRPVQVWVSADGTLRRVVGSISYATLGLVQKSRLDTTMSFTPMPNPARIAIPAAGVVADRTGHAHDELIKIFKAAVLPG
jgi:hypothetical protein